MSLWNWGKGFRLHELLPLEISRMFYNSKEFYADLSRAPDVREDDVQWEWSLVSNESAMNMYLLTWLKSAVRATRGITFSSLLWVLETKLPGWVTRRSGMKEQPTQDEQKLDSFVKKLIQRNPLLLIEKYSPMLKNLREDPRLDQ